ncbi:hypothetical protein CMT45_00820 [Elizabethkingia anophelis]|uniref:hypothetical protein n=1 Tax=Elizabethkingia anophelis TaxID=1117645 RepID=UPI00293C1D81|nr:hypothetical protein [Elizabethkingia anophelis]MDV4070256.1 hypothetical protein [Elizabethkingia anophelis]
MKKTLLIFVLISGFTFGQFTVSETSKDWQDVGSYWGSIKLRKSSNKAELLIEDFKSVSVTAFESQNKIDKLNRSIENANSGIVNGFRSFIFSIEPDTLDKLYSLIIDHFKTKEKEELTLDFPEGKLYLNFKKVNLIYSVTFGIDNDAPNSTKSSVNRKIYSMPITKGNVDKIFGKK